MEVGDAPMTSKSRDRSLLALTLMLVGATTVVGGLAPLDHLGNSTANLAALVAWLAWVVIHSVVVRGTRRTGQFVLVAGGCAFMLEAAALHFTNAFQHSLHPQVLGVPVPIVGGWIVYLYAGYAVTLALTSPGQTWAGAVAFSVVAALVTTALDLTADPVGVRTGSFAYHQGGGFMPEIQGFNGARGIPLMNYAGWLALATAAYVAFWFWARGAEDRPIRGRVTALLFYVGLFAATAIPAVRLGYAQLLLIGGLPVALVALLAAHHLVVDRRAREHSIRGKERARVTSLVERRLAAHRR